MQERFFSEALRLRWSSKYSRLRHLQDYDICIQGIRWRLKWVRMRIFGLYSPECPYKMIKDLPIRWDSFGWSQRDESNLSVLGNYASLQWRIQEGMMEMTGRVPSQVWSGGRYIPAGKGITVEYNPGSRTTRGRQPGTPIEYLLYHLG
jgi:hypothetical protein